MRANLTRCILCAVSLALPLGCAPTPTSATASPIWTVMAQQNFSANGTVVLTTIKGGLGDCYLIVSGLTGTAITNVPDHECP